MTQEPKLTVEPRARKEAWEVQRKLDRRDHSCREPGRGVGSRVATPPGRCATRGINLFRTLIGDVCHKPNDFGSMTPIQYDGSWVVNQTILVDDPHMIQQDMVRVLGEFGSMTPICYNLYVL